MSAFGNTIERWNIKSTGVIAGLGHSERISPVRSMTTLVDSAYSSFSGGSYVPEYQNSFQQDGCHYNDEQLSYMDSEYVRAIYNPSVLDKDGVYNDIVSEHGSSKVALSGRSSSSLCSDNTTYVHRTSPAKLDNYVTNLDSDQVSEKYIYGDPINMKHKQNHPNHKAYGLQRNSPTGINSLQEKENQLYNPSNYMEIKDNYFDRSLDVLQADGDIRTQDSYTQNALYFPQNLPDQYRNSQYPGANRMSKEHFKGNDLQNSNEENKERDGPYLTKDGPFVQGQYASDVRTSFKNIRRSLKKSASGKIVAHDSKDSCWIMKPGKDTPSYNSEGTITDMEYDNREQWDIRKSRLSTRASQTLYCESNDDVSGPPLKAMNSKNEVDQTLGFQKDATVKSIPLLSQQLQQIKSKSHPLSDLNCEKITKASTPMLYHLAGGRHSAFIAPVHNTNPAQQEKLKLESKTMERMNNISVLQLTEPRPDNHKLPKNKSLTQLADLHDSAEGGNSGNLNSSAEESLMNDYIEKLKVAQKKVLRETSFKRKDLQMSLPCRFKLNPSKRPTIDHFRSYSSSSANEESAYLQTKSFADSSYKKDDTEKVAVTRIGGRKRITKEQKKLCYSEPEKLDHLGIQKSNFAWKEEPTFSNKREMSDSDISANRIKYLESKERTTSSSNLSKTELKQIQHNALVEYMERKANQKPNSNSQVPMERTSLGLPNYNEWSIYSSETSSSDASQKYLRRRSAGASSSYDATVTWNDRFGKTSPLGRSAAEQTAGVQRKTFSDQRTLDGSQEHLEGSSPSLSQKTSKSTHNEQVSYVNMEFLPSALSKNHMYNDRLTVPGDSAESGRMFVSKSRGKSMEEIGTTDIVKLAELSHSSDQLYHIKGPVISSRLENTKPTAASHHNKLLASTQNETGNLPRQTHQESVVRPRRSDLANLGQEAHSWPLRASAVSPGTDNPCSSSPAEVQHSAPEPLHCLETEDEVFTAASTARNEEPSSTAFSYLHSTGKPVSQGEATALFFTVLPDQDRLEHPIVSETTPSSESDENVSDAAAEKEMATQLPETSKVNKPLGFIFDNQELEGDGEPMQPEFIDGSQQLELSSLPSSQVNIMQTVEHYLGDDKNSRNEDTLEHKTEDLEQKSKNLEEEEEGNLPKVKLKSPEDERREELVKEIVAKDKSLMNCLQPVSVRESAMDLMKSLFPMDFTAAEKSRTRGLLGKDNRETLKKNNLDLESSSKLPSKITMMLQKRPDGESLDDITLKKMELLSNIGSKLEDLCEQKEFLLSDISINTTNGNNMQTKVKELCKPNEFERYMMFIGDLEKVVSLLFSLSTRLTRVENSLSKVDENTDAEEMQSLKERHNLLSSQREDAKELKTNLDRREQVVTGILVKYLNEEQLQDYKHFVRLKTSLLIEQKNLEEKIKVYEEQFESVHNSIPP